MNSQNFIKKTLLLVNLFVMTPFLLQASAIDETPLSDDERDSLAIIRSILPLNATPEDQAKLLTATPTEINNHIWTSTGFSDEETLATVMAGEYVVHMHNSDETKFMCPPFTVDTNVVLKVNIIIRRTSDDELLDLSKVLHVRTDITTQLTAEEASLPIVQRFKSAYTFAQMDTLANDGTHYREVTYPHLLLTAHLHHDSEKRDALLETNKLMLQMLG